MPEGPELYLAGVFVNKVCQGKIFSGKITKSEVNKNPEIDWNEPSYTISAVSRGKETKLRLTSIGNGLKSLKESRKTTIKPEPKTLDIVFRFGMSGKFRFDPVNDLHKHAHLNFYTSDGGMALTFVDVRRFGSWEPGGDWQPKRGPCVIQDYQLFRKHVLSKLDHKAFDRPICETLLNQNYFNGIGNYLRAEILFRTGVKPFECARDVLTPLAESKECIVKSEQPDILTLCNTLPVEVIALGPGVGYDPEAGAMTEGYSAFAAWLQCYYKDGMKNMADHNKRTIWFSGDPGPMVPKETKTRKTKKQKKTVKKEGTEVSEDKPITPSRKRKSTESIKTETTSQKLAKMARSKVTKRVSSPTLDTPTSKRKSIKNGKMESVSTKRAKIPRDKISKTVNKRRSHLKTEIQSGDETVKALNETGSTDCIDWTDVRGRVTRSTRKSLENIVKTEIKDEGKNIRKRQRKFRR